MAACEWNPVEKRPAFDDDLPHGEAVWAVGCDGKWHLCEGCAASPDFARYRNRRRLRRRVPARVKRRANRQASVPQKMPSLMRRYIHDLETKCDPVCDQQTIAVLREKCQALQKVVREQADEIERLKEKPQTPETLAHIVRLYDELRAAALRLYGSYSDWSDHFGGQMNALMDALERISQAEGERRT